jgi:hypothetical protein
MVTSHELLLLWLIYSAGVIAVWIVRVALERQRQASFLLASFVDHALA